MNAGNKAGKRWLVYAATLLLTVGASSREASAIVAKAQVNCQSAITKAVGKHLSAVGKAMQACQDAALAAGTDPAACPDATALEAIQKSEAKAGAAAAKKCQSTCSLSGVSCIDTEFCPPSGKLAGQVPATEVCVNGLSASGMGFPGPYCESLIGHSMQEPNDFALCSVALGQLMYDQLSANVYGSLDGTPALSSGAAECLTGIVKAAPKAIAKAASTVAKCRNTQLTAAVPAINEDDCPTADLKTSDGIDKAKSKVISAIALCSDAQIQELDLCGEGVGGVLTVAAAQACVDEVLNEIAYSLEIDTDRTYAPVSIINGAYPLTSPVRCGDNVINQIPSQFLLNGEECDGVDDDACPGECLPPGDLFECTCGTVRRARSFANGFAADLDNGWSGSSHNNSVTDGAGFVSVLSNCDCDHFDPANPSTCDGVSSDQVCDTFAEIKPRCSHRIGDHTTCDEVGDEDGVNEDGDCRVCDDFSANAGAVCRGRAQYCIDGANNGDRCNEDGDCPGGSCSGIGQCAMDGGAFQGQGCTLNSATACGICTAGNVGAHCTINSNCGLGGVCEQHNCWIESCAGGANDGDPCSSTANVALPDQHCPGGSCVATSDCQAQCFDEAGVPQGNCYRQADCAEGERCRGNCNTENYCLKMRNGAPLPLSAEGTSVCLDSQFHTNATGTKDVVTGAHAVNYELRSVTYLTNDINSNPCPVCGGWCEVNTPSTTKDRWRCNGSCTGPELECRYGPNIGEPCVDNTNCDGFLCAAVACRFDSDCPSGTCSGDASPDCQGKDCTLALTCNSGPNQFEPCRIEAATAFGTTSADCETGGNNQTGSGLEIHWEPLTSEAVDLPFNAACDSPGYENYDCNCVFGGGSTRNQPNRCGAACNDPNPAYYGDACPALTVCVGGADDGDACDEDSDCDLNDCSGNPRTCGTGNQGVCTLKTCIGGTLAGGPCVGDVQCPGGGTCGPTEVCTVGGAPCTNGTCDPDDCTTNADCEMGVTCDDVCPAGRCTPLCVPRGLCDGGDRDGDGCALDTDCVGGGTCLEESGVCSGGDLNGVSCARDAQCPGGTCQLVPAYVEEGACANGAFNHCDGPGWEFVSCSPLNVGTQQGCEMGTDAVLGNSNDFVGAGYCRADITNCFINDGAAVGGSTANGRGDATHQYSTAAFCIPASQGSAVNATAGLPGPGRIRQPSLSVPNFTVLP